MASKSVQGTYAEKSAGKSSTSQPFQTADSVIWMDGVLTPYAQAQVHVLSHSLHYGSAAFEGVRAYRTQGGRTAIFRAREHTQRLFRTMGILGGHVPFSEDQVISAMGEVIKANNLDECYLRPIAYFGPEVKGLKLPLQSEMKLTIACWPWGKYLGDGNSNKGIRVKVASFRRPEVGSSLPWAKLSGNYLNSIMARREATLAQVDEAILLDQQGFVAEGSGENIFVVANKKIFTPFACNVLQGITRESVMEIAQHLGYEVSESMISRNQLYDAHEVFFTGTAAEITPIGEIDGRQIRGGEVGPVTKDIVKSFEASIRGSSDRWEDWLTYI
jgi:branched-chain amino acid aminotransferase